MKTKNYRFNLMAYTEQQAFYGGLIHGEGLYSKRVGVCLVVYIRNHFCDWSFSHLLFVSQERGME